MFENYKWNKALENNDIDTIKKIVSTFNLEGCEPYDKDLLRYRRAIWWSISDNKNELLDFLLNNATDACLEQRSEYDQLDCPEKSAVNASNYHALKKIIQFLGKSVVNRVYKVRKILGDDSYNDDWHDVSLLYMALTRNNRLITTRNKMLFNDKKIVRLLIESGVDVTNGLIGSALSDYDTVKLMLEKGANPNYQYGWSQKSPLHRTDDEKIIELLIKNGANQNLKNRHGTSAYESVELRNSLPFSSNDNPHQKYQGLEAIEDSDAEYKHTVTIVDDRGITLESCKKLLQEKGYRLASDSSGIHTIIDSTNNKEMFKGSSPNVIYDWTYSAKNKLNKPIKGKKLDNGFELWKKEELSNSKLREISNVDYGDYWYDMPRGELPKYFAAKRSNDYDFALLYGADNVEDIKNWAKKQTP
jgi:hypothetical protein